ncbi:hypothetical protein BD309DRAFT_667895 [Dichomitus squalens]|nr:hypothetical protein BD309DRAFT_667895 [Dichomitus squalens]
MGRPNASCFGASLANGFGAESARRTANCWPGRFRAAGRASQKGAHIPLVAAIPAHGPTVHMACSSPQVLLCGHTDARASSTRACMRGVCAVQSTCRGRSFNKVCGLPESDYRNRLRRPGRRART